MQRETIYSIIRQYIGKTHENDVQQAFQRWLTHPQDADEKELALLEIWNQTAGTADLSTIEDLEHLHRQIGQRKKRKIRPILFLRVAAIFILLLGTSLLTYHWMEFSRKEINLTECFVDNGDRRQIILPDGSIVWINSGSLLVYPENFDGKTRSVFLNGEANFTVTPNKEKPFIVKTNYLEIEALGTVFNVQAYSDFSKTTATLEEGKIRVVTQTEKPQTFIVDPDEQVVFDHQTYAATKIKADALRIASWKEGYMFFQNASLDEIVHSVSKKFNVFIQFDPVQFKGRSFTVRLAPDKTLEQTLRVLEDVCKFHYTIKGNTVYIR